MVTTLTICAMLQRMSLSLQAATKVTEVGGQNISNADEFLQLKDRDIEGISSCHKTKNWVSSRTNRKQNTDIGSYS
jgi:hypothetical protein